MHALEGIYHSFDKSTKTTENKWETREFLAMFEHEYEWIFIGKITSIWPQSQRNTGSPTKQIFVKVHVEHKTSSWMWFWFHFNLSYECWRAENMKERDTYTHTRHIHQNKFLVSRIVFFPRIYLVRRITDTPFGYR